MTAIKVAEEGPRKGLIIRAWETDGKTTQASFDISSLGFKSAIKTDLLERDHENLVVLEGKILVTIPARGFLIMRLKDSPQKVQE